MFTAAAVFAIALVHEDVALLAAAFFMHQHGLPPLLAVALIVSGILGNSLVLYGIGVVTRRHGWVHRRLLGVRGRAVARPLERRLIATVLLARIGQGLATPTMVGRGWLSVPLARVACAVTLAAVLYAAPMVTLVFLFGEQVIGWLAHAGWIALALAAGVVGLVVWRARRALCDD